MMEFDGALDADLESDYQMNHNHDAPVCGENGLCGACDECNERKEADDTIEWVLETAQEMYDGLDKIRNMEMALAKQKHQLGNAQQCLEGIKSFLGKMEGFGSGN